MKNYLFIENSTKPNVTKFESKGEYILSNFSQIPLSIAKDLNYNTFMGVNRKFPSELKNDLVDGFYNANIYRSIFNIKDNWCAYKNMIKFVKEKSINFIHCNTPIGGFIGRVVGHKLNTKTIIYTAHGFHFFKGNSIVKNIIFKNIEKKLAKKTDVIITMNEEDFVAAKKFKLRKDGKVYKINGVGIDIPKYVKKGHQRTNIRKELGLDEKSKICISAGDLIKRKNYRVAIKAIAKLKNDNIHYIICGNGPEEKALRKLAIKLEVKEYIHFLGFRTDMINLYHESNLFLFTTLQEGLPRSLMEAMASGIPIVASKVRGNVDLIDHDKGGFLANKNNPSEYARFIDKILKDDELAKTFVSYNNKKILSYSTEFVKTQLENIYKKHIEINDNA